MFRGLYRWRKYSIIWSHVSRVTLSAVPRMLRPSGWEPKWAAMHFSCAPNGGWSSYLAISSRITSFSVSKSAGRSAGRRMSLSSSTA